MMKRRELTTNTMAAPLNEKPEGEGLSEARVRQLAVPAKGNRVTYFSGDVLQGIVAPRGFGVRITAGGSRAFVLNYWIGQRERRYTIGEWKGSGGGWPVIAAMKHARDLRQRIDKGEDPLGERRPIGSKGVKTVSAILDDFMDRYARNRDRPLRSADLIEQTFKRLVKPRIGDLGIYNLHRSDVVKMLDEIEDNHGPVMADRALAYTRKALTWHAARDDGFALPIVRGMARTKPKERARRRFLADEEILDVLTAAAGMTEPACYRGFIRALLLTAQRRTEVAQMRWDEIAQDAGADKLTWVIPADRYKTGVENVVPLSAAARTLIGKRKKDVGPFVFSTDGGKVPFSGFSKAKAALDKRVAELRAKAGREPMAPWVLHDLRRTARSLMSRAGVDSDIAERVLGHAIPGVRSVYDRHHYLAEKRAALERLAALVAEILEPPPEKVTRLSAHRRVKARAAQ